MIEGVGRLTAIVFGVLFAIMLITGRFLVVAFLVLQLAFVVCLAIFLVERTNRLSNALEEQRIRLGEARRDTADLEQAVLALRRRQQFVPGDYVGHGVNGGNGRLAEEDTTWPGRPKVASS